MQHAEGTAPSTSEPAALSWPSALVRRCVLRGRDVIAPLVLNPVVLYAPCLPPPDDMPSRGRVSVRQHFLRQRQTSPAKRTIEHVDSGDGVQVDAAVAGDGGQVADEGDATPPSSEQQNVIRVVSLNMEMGKRMGDIIGEMKRLQPDVLLLQEVDLCCPRSGNVDCAGELAQELGMACVFACEVENPSKFPGEAEVFEAGGRQGNAILSRFPVKEAWPVLVTCRKARHSHSAYKTHAEAAAVLETPHGDLLCYSVHLDPHFAGVEGRIAQYLEILDDALLHYAPPRPPRPTDVSAAHESEDEDEDENEDEDDGETISRAQYALIAGDLNTVTTGIARLAPSIGWTKSSWWTSLGWTEAEWFDVHGVARGNADKGLDFADPFDKRRDATFDGLGGLYGAKLDWCLLSGGLSPVHHEVGQSRSCSDHNWILVDVVMK